MQKHLNEKVGEEQPPTPSVQLHDSRFVRWGYLAAGFAAGYYLGAKAGRQRYDQINRVARKVKRSEAIDLAADKAKAVVDLGVERARDLVDRSS